MACGTLSPSWCTKGQSVPSIGCIRIADLVRSRFETTSRRTMKNSFEQRRANKFCIKLDKKVTETYELLKQAYRKSALSCILQGGRRMARKGWMMTRVVLNFDCRMGFRVRQRRPLLGCSGKTEEKGHPRTKRHRRYQNAVSRQRVQQPHVSACPRVRDKAQWGNAAATTLLQTLPNSG